MRNPAASIQAVLEAFVRVLAQPLDQDLEDSVRAATTSIILVSVLAGATALYKDATVRDTIGTSLVLVLVWMAVTAIVAKAEQKVLAIARSLTVVSFWIAATLVFVLASEAVAGPFALTVRFAGVSFALLILVPVHMFRSLPVGAALYMTLSLWISTGFLAWNLVF